jgi:CAAX prenyl protease-like protein
VEVEPGQEAQVVVGDYLPGRARLLLHPNRRSYAVQLGRLPHQGLDLERRPPEPAPRGATALPAWLAGLAPASAAAWLALRVLGSVAVVPLAEELAFRAYLPRRLLAADFEAVPLDRFAWVPFLVSSAAFGALHGRWLAGVLAGMLYALILYRRKSVAAPVLAHATTNALIAAYVLAAGAWTLWV